MLQKLLALLVLTMIVGAALAAPQTKKELIEAYRAERGNTWAQCYGDLVVAESNLFMGEGEVISRHEECIRGAKTRLQAAYDRARRAIPSPAARAAFAKVHAAAIAVLVGMWQDKHENQQDYEARKKRLNAELDAAWARYEAAQ